MAEIYKTFGADDIVPGDIQTVSQPLWSEGMNPFSASYSASAGIGFFTSSTQVANSSNYLVNIYHRNPATDPAAAVQFAIAYGHRAGSGSVGDANTIGQNINDTPSRAIYSQYRNMLLPPTDSVFTFGSDNPDDIMVINIARSRFRQKIDPGNWTLRLPSGSAAGNNWTGSINQFREFTDNSGATDTPTVNQAGRVFNIMSGSNGTAVGTDVYGLFYPDAGIMVFDANKLKTKLNMPINSGSQVQAKNHISMSLAIKGASYFSARSEEKITSTHYFVRINNKQYNFSNNPTFVSGSNGTFLHSSMLRNPSVYITTIGMYDNSNRLVAVAKLSKPLLKSFNREALIKVKLDY